MGSVQDARAVRAVSEGSACEASNSCSGFRSDQFYGFLFSFFGPDEIKTVFLIYALASSVSPGLCTGRVSGSCY